MAYLLSWTAWTPYVLSENGLGIWNFHFPTVFGDSQLAGIIPGAFLGSILSGFLVTAAADGGPGLRTWTGRLLRFGVGWRWYLGVLTGVPAVIFVVALVYAGGQFRLPSETALVTYLPLLAQQVLTTGLAEEPGWRDFALPRMQRRNGSLVGSLILGVLWGAWHLPLFLTDYWNWPHVSPLTPVVFVATATAINFVMTWVFNRTGESLPLAMLAHASINNFTGVIAADMFPSLSFANLLAVVLIGASAATVVLLVMTRGRLGCHPPVPGTAAA